MTGFEKDVRLILLTRYAARPEHASAEMLCGAIAEACRLRIAEDWNRSRLDGKSCRRVAYLSAEFLTGRALTANLFALGLTEEVKGLLSRFGADLNTPETEEDAALGNGGLGRLAACFLDSAACLDLPVMGYGLKYRYGLFKQGIDRFCQTEAPDDWTRAGDAWTMRRDDRTVTVEMADGDVLAVPYDLPVIGYNTHTVGTLRLWQTESPHEFDFSLFNDYRYSEACADKNRCEDITKVLYPNDWNIEGKRLRLKQQYVLASASLQDLLRNYRETHKGWRSLCSFAAVQLNDTHPVLAIPELIRLLMKEGVSFKTAVSYAGKIFAYTNHTVMPEALEKWDLSLIASLQPEIAAILKRLDRLCRRETGMPLIRDGRVSMADTAVYMSFAVNGVAEIHSGLLKTFLFPEWYARFPERFTNKTNGVTFRRWLGLCNPELTGLLNSRAGGDVIADPGLLSSVCPTQELASGLAGIKSAKKTQLCDYVRSQCGIDLPDGFAFDVQIKRLHEYKRQLLNALSLYDLYLDLKNGVLTDLPPVAFLFAGKAAPGYARAKAVIRYINALAERVNNDPDVAGKMRICFIPNYNCSVAEKIIPAADFSGQISPAGTEASGTGNMKLMLNGAVTIGTWDGANIEIAKAAGTDNEIVFGARIEELDRIRDTYRPRDLYEGNARIRRAVDSLTDAGFPDEDGMLAELKTSLLDGASWHKPDHYFVLYDFESYREARLKAYRLYKTDRSLFEMMCLKNTLSAGPFSSDRTVREYARDIWKI